MHELTTIVTSTPLDVTILGWLHAKSNKSGSKETQKKYTETIQQFRDLLRQNGLDLDSGSEEEQVRIAFLAQAYAAHSAVGKQVKPATINQRLAILSSFYTYAMGKKLVVHNPIDGVERSKVQAYGGARALEMTTTQGAFQQIDTTTLRGKRDYALLALSLQTGRRLSEIASLQLQHLTLSGGKVTISFEHCKRGKVMRDTLPVSVSRVLLDYLHSFYGQDLTLGYAGDTHPVFVSLSRGGKSGKTYGKQLGTQAIADVCEKYLGTSKVHATRHTFAHTMERAGASVSEIQARLGHESLATTGTYLAQLKQAENKYADTLAALLGIA
jgi:site-specific recombinase XerD